MIFAPTRNRNFLNFRLNPETLIFWTLRKNLFIATFTIKLKSNIHVYLF